METQLQATTPAPEPTDKPVVSGKPTLSDQYSLGDEAGDSQTVAAASVNPVVTEPQAGDMQAGPGAHASADRPRGPDGRFLPLSQTPQANAEPTPPPTHPARLVRMARDLGIEESEIASMSTDVLDHVVYHRNKQLLDLMRERQAEESRESRRSGETGQPPETQEPASQPEDELGFDAAQYDPNIIGAFRSHQSRIKQLESQVQQLHRWASARQNQSDTAKIDRAFASMGAEFEPLIGKGDGRALAKNSPEMRKRLQVLKIVQGMGPEDGSLEEKVVTVTKGLFGAQAVPKAKTPENGQTRIRDEDWNAAALRQPTQRSGAAEPTGTEKAVRNLEQRLRELGGEPVREPAVLDEFLG